MVEYAVLTTDQLWDQVCSGQEAAISELLRRLDKVILAESRFDGRVNEDVAQDIREKLMIAIRKRFGTGDSIN